MNTLHYTPRVNLPNSVCNNMRSIGCERHEFKPRVDPNKIVTKINFIQ